MSRSVSAQTLRQLKERTQAWLGPTVAVGARALLEPRPKLYEEEEALVAGAISKRQREFAHGRDLIRQLLCQRGDAPQAILRDPSRRPTWPPGLWGSVTHTDEVVMAALGPASPTFGIDLEGAEPLGADLLAMILRPEEVREHGQDLHHAKRVFSAKEAFYKAQHVHTQTVLDFREVSLNWSGEEFSVEVHHAHASRQLPGAAMGSTVKIGPFVLSACWFMLG